MWQGESSSSICISPSTKTSCGNFKISRSIPIYFSLLPQVTLLTCSSHFFPIVDYTSFFKTHHQVLIQQEEKSSQHFHKSKLPGLVSQLKSQRTPFFPSTCMRVGVCLLVVDGGCGEESISFTMKLYFLQSVKDSI